MNWELTKQHRKLKALAKKAGDASLDDFELLAHWAKYLCVLVAGFLENALIEVYGEFVVGSSSPAVARFATTRLENIQNPKAQRFLEIAGAFDEAWRIELEQFLAVNGRKEAVDSIMSNRHQIAHGETSGITLTRVNQYLEKCIEVIDFLEAQCKGQH